MKDQLAEKIITKFVGLRQKIYSYLVDDGSEDKKRKTHKKVCHKKKNLWKLENYKKFENYKICVEATQLDSKIKYLEKNKNNTDSLKKSWRIYKNQYKSILKTRQRFMGEKHNVLTEENNKLVLTSED